MDDQKERVINPFTGRAILVGGRTYNLVESLMLEELERKCNGQLDPNRRRVYCGDAQVIPNEYTRRGTPRECLGKGYKTGMCTTYRKLRILR